MRSLNVLRGAFDELMKMLVQASVTTTRRRLTMTSEAVRMSFIVRLLVLVLCITTPIAKGESRMCGFVVCFFEMILSLLTVVDEERYLLPAFEQE